MAIPERPRILFVEDERSISEPFSKALAREGFEPHVAGTAARALELADSLDPDLILLDLHLPDGDGRDLCRTIRARSGVPIIILTARGTETDRIVGLELGADDYVVKPFSGGEVIARIRAVLRRAAPARAAEDEAPEAPVTIDDLHVDLAARRATLKRDEMSLSRKEFDLLAELVRNAGRVVTREAIMDRVWDENWFGSTKTLDVHVRWLRGKLGETAENAHYLQTVRGVGFRFRAPEEPR
jgi:two-component system response regulator RegX3